MIKFKGSRDGMTWEEKIRKEVEAKKATLRKEAEEKAKEEAKKVLEGFPF